jgi:hypothetical protein
MVWAPDSLIFGHLIRRPHIDHLTLGRAVDLFLAAKAAEGAAAKTLEWYGMILRRAVRGLGEERPIEQLAGPELRAWILELRATLSTISVAGYVRTLKVFGNWLAAEELAQAAALRTLRMPRVPDKLVDHEVPGPWVAGDDRDGGRQPRPPSRARRAAPRPPPVTVVTAKGDRPPLAVVEARIGLEFEGRAWSTAGPAVEWLPEVSQCSRWPSVTAMTWI